MSCPFLTPAAALVEAQQLLGEAKSQAQASLLNTAAAHQELAELSRQHEILMAQIHVVQVGLCKGDNNKGPAKLCCKGVPCVRFRSCSYPGGVFYLIQPDFNSIKPSCFNVLHHLFPPCHFAASSNLHSYVGHAGFIQPVCRDPEPRGPQDDKSMDITLIQLLEYVV